MLVEELENFARQGVEAELIMVQCLYPVPLVTSSLSWRGKENQTKLLMSCNWPKSIDINKGVQESLRLFWSWFNLCPLVIHHYVHWAMARLDWLQCLYPVHHSRWLVHNHEEGKIKQNLIDVMQLTKVNWHWYRCSGELENSPGKSCIHLRIGVSGTAIYMNLHSSSDDSNHHHDSCCGQGHPQIVVPTQWNTSCWHRSYCVIKVLDWKTHQCPQLTIPTSWYSKLCAAKHSKLNSLHSNTGHQPWPTWIWWSNSSDPPSD